MNIKHFLTTVLLCASVSGCAAKANPKTHEIPTTPHGTDPHSCVAPGTWYAPGSQQTLSAQDVLARHKDDSVVLLGETHVVADHHRWQLHTVAQFHAQRPDLILGFEAFPRRVQPVLDRWVAGELSEQEFLKQSDWNTVWKYDAELYLPLFHYARINGVPMVALNVDRSLTAQVSKDGWAAVPVEDRRGVGDPSPALQGYLDMLGNIYGRHANGNGEENGAPKAPGLEDPAFSNFVDVQLTWDRAMAEATASALKKARDQGRDPQMIAIIGRGHMDFGFGVPYQLANLGINDIAVLTPWDKLRDCENLHLKDAPPVASAVFGLNTTNDYFQGDKPKLGVIIETTEGGVRVNKVMDQSIAQAAGIKDDDLITHAAGQAVSKSSDLVGVITTMPPGTWLPLTVQRGARTVEIVARFPAPQPEPEPEKDAAKP